MKRVRVNKARSLVVIGIAHMYIAPTRLNRKIDRDLDSRQRKRRLSQWNWSYADLLSYVSINVSDYSMCRNLEFQAWDQRGGNHDFAGRRKVNMHPVSCIQFGHPYFV